MTEDKLLHEYKWREFPALVTRISRKQVKLFATIIKDEAMYFIPDDDPGNRQKAESGQYEIYDTDSVMSTLEEIHKIYYQDSNSHVPVEFRLETFPDFSRNTLELRSFISPTDERGMLGRESSPEDPLDPMVIIFSRIRVEDNAAIDKGNTKKTVSEEVNPQSEKSYLRLIGVLAKKLEELKALDPNPGPAAGQVVSMAKHMRINGAAPIGQPQRQAVKAKLALAAAVLNNPDFSVPKCKNLIKNSPKEK